MVHASTKLPTGSKIVVVSIAGAIMLTAASPADAAFCTRRRAEREEGLYKTRVAVLNEIQKRMDVMRSARGGPVRHVANDRVARFRTLADTMLLRFEAAQERERQLCARLDRKILDLQVKSQNVAPAKTALIRAENQWLATGHLFEELKLKLNYVSDSDDPLNSFEEIRALAKRTKEELQKTNAALIETAIALKAVMAR